MSSNDISAYTKTYCCFEYVVLVSLKLLTKVAKFSFDCKKYASWKYLILFSLSFRTHQKHNFDSNYTNLHQCIKHKTYLSGKISYFLSFKQYG